MKSEWHVYIVSCRDRTLYAGITTDLPRRLAEHNSGKNGARYTRSRQPVNLVFSEPADSRSAAAQREWHIKHMTVTQKLALIELSKKKTDPENLDRATTKNDPHKEVD